MLKHNRRGHGHARTKTRVRCNLATGEGRPLAVDHEPGQSRGQSCPRRNWPAAAFAAALI